MVKRGNFPVFASYMPFLNKTLKMKITPDELTENGYVLLDN